MTNYLTMLVMGESKVGKTTLAATSPKPLLVLDAEAGGMRFVEGKQTDWDPGKGAPEPGYDIYRVDVSHVEQLDQVYQYLISRAGGTFFKAVVFDSVTELQARIKREINSDGLLDQQGWGRILAKFESLVWQYRDLAASAHSTIQVVVFISGMRHRDGKFRPYMQGQLVDQLPYKLDVAGYLFTREDGEGNWRRALRIRNSETHVVGERVTRPDGTTPAGNTPPDVIWDPSILGIVEMIYGPEETDESDGSA